MIKRFELSRTDPRYDDQEIIESDTGKYIVHEDLVNTIRDLYQQQIRMIYERIGGKLGYGYLHVTDLTEDRDLARLINHPNLITNLIVKLRLQRISMYSIEAADALRDLLGEIMKGKDDEDYPDGYFMIDFEQGTCYSYSKTLESVGSTEDAALAKYWSQLDVLNF